MFWGRKWPETKYFKCKHSCSTKWHNISNAIFHCSALESEHCWLLWHPLRIEEPLLSKACKWRHSRGNFLLTATIKFKNQTAAISSTPVKEQMPGFYGRICLLYPYYTLHSSHILSVPWSPLQPSSFRENSARKKKKKAGIWAWTLSFPELGNSGSDNTTRFMVLSQPRLHPTPNRL